MELTFFAVAIGWMASCIVAGLWAGIAMVTGIDLPTVDQVYGLMLIGACGLPVVGWAVALLNP